MNRMWAAVALRALAGLLWTTNAQAAPDVGALQDLGKQVFFDNISSPERQACATCHAPATGWTSKVAGINLGQVAVTGADPHTVGGRRPPTVAYASFSPGFSSESQGCASQLTGILCSGGLFWDGRATGETIGAEVFAQDPSLQVAYESFLGPIADQALGPFANEVEQNVPPGNDGVYPGGEAVCLHVQSARYAELYELAWGEPIDCSTPGAADLSFARIAVAISAWEQSAEVNQFGSRRDLALLSDDDETPGAFPLAGLTAQENLGHDLFFGEARCSACHNSEGAGSQGNEPLQVYTDHRFHHLGVPANHEIANFDPEAPDFGLSHHTNPDYPAAGGHAGHFRTPTLRNVAKRPGQGFPKAYMHNGYFKNLEDVVHFYNTATEPHKVDPVDCPPGTTAGDARARDCWPEAEVNNGLQASNFGVFGRLGLSSEEEAALVAYLEILTDLETVKKPKPYK